MAETEKVTVDPNFQPGVMSPNSKQTFAGEIASYSVKRKITLPLKFKKETAG